MRALFAQGASHAGDRLTRMAAELEERGHEIVLTRPGDGWRGVLALGRLLAERDVEIAVAEEPQALALLRGARHLHRSTQVTGLAAADVEAAETELEAARVRGRDYGRAVFLDRDGTLLPEVGALGRPEAVRLLPGVAAALRTLSAARYELVVISNQSAIGRGLVTESEVRAVHAALRRLLRAESVELAGIYFCPHRPEDACDCRKPAPGMLLRAAAGLGLHLSDSWMIGDSTRDTEAAAAAGVRGILLDTGWGGGDPAAPLAAAPLRARDLRTATERILRA